MGDFLEYILGEFIGYGDLFEDFEEFLRKC